MIITDEKILRIPCSDVLLSEVGELRDLLQRELDFANKNGARGIGLAAPQIGIHKKIAIVRVGEGLNVDLVNCTIAQGYDKTLFEGEGCLSYPGVYERTMRFQEIHVVNNLIGPNDFIATGMFGVVIQHENDHLNNILLPDVALSKPKVVNGKKLKPNDICFCGSNVKFKRCHGKV